MVSERMRKLIYKITSDEIKSRCFPPTERKKIEKIVVATINAFANELREEVTEADFGNGDRGERYLSAIPESTIIRIKDEWLE